MSFERKNITQPANWWAEWQRLAESEGLTLSEWIGKQCNKVAKIKEKRPARGPKRKGLQGGSRRV